MRNILDRLVLIILLTTFNYSTHAESGEHTEVNYDDIIDIFKKCTPCHGENITANSHAWFLNGLFLDSFDSIRDGGITGNTVLPGNPDGSWLVNRIQNGTDLLRRNHLSDRPLTKTEIEKIKMWIAQGAKPGPNTIREPKIEIRKFQTNGAPLYIYCHPSDPNGAFLRIRVSDPETGQVLESDWDDASGNKWSSWEHLGQGSIRGGISFNSIHRSKWPDEIGIKLSIRSKGVSTGDGTIFIVSNEPKTNGELNEIMEQKNYMKPSFVQLPMDKLANFYVSFPNRSHVLLKVWKEENNVSQQEILYESNMRNLPSGENEVPWDIKRKNGRYLTSGRYTANFDIKPAKNDVTTNLQILVSFSVRYLTDWK